mgnify:CR=1 FL=1
MTLLERINAMGTTMLVVTHERDLVNRFSKRVVAIKDGEMIRDPGRWRPRCAWQILDCPAPSFSQ